MDKKLKLPKTHEILDSEEMEYLTGGRRNTAQLAVLGTLAGAAIIGAGACAGLAVKKKKLFAAGKAEVVTKGQTASRGATAYSSDHNYLRGSLAIGGAAAGIGLGGWAIGTPNRMGLDD